MHTKLAKCDKWREVNVPKATFIKSDKNKYI